MVIRAVLIVALFAVLFTLDLLRPQGEYALHDLAYNPSVGPPYEIHTPVTMPVTFDLQFDALAKGSPATFLQAKGPTGDSVRFEVRPPRRLVMAVFDVYTPVLLNDSFNLNRWHHFELRGSEDGRFDVAVDGRVTHYDMSEIRQSQSSAEIGAKDFAFRFSTIRIGSGGPAPLVSNDRIANLDFTSRYIEALPWWVVLFGDGVVTCAVIWLMLPLLLRTEKPELSRSDSIVLAGLIGATFAGFIVYAMHIPPGKWAILLGIGIGSVAGSIVATNWRSIQVPVKLRTASLIGLITLSICSLFMLPNWAVTIRMFWRWPLTSMFSLTLAVCAGMLIVNTFAKRARATRTVIWLDALPYLLFAALALRTDSLVAPINALHWDYVLGPIRALRDGGWLLWDVPSQYGFLSVLIPAVLPVHPAANAFYYFQAAALFAAAAVLYRTLYASLAVQRWLACLIVVVFFFFADPLLIGPAPYPSMSAVRFLWCYVLVAIAVSNFLGPKPSIERFARWSTGVWIVALLWSAESAIYATVIFFTPLLLSILRSRRDELSLRTTSAITLFGLPIVCALATFALVDLIYLVRIGHEADWGMYIAYIRSYGSGFGEVPIPFYGPVVYICLILFSGAAVFTALRKRGFEAPAYAAATAFSLVWIVSSYYLGRAFPVVITALFPLLILGAFSIIRAGGSLDKRPIAPVLVLPLVALSLASVLWNANVPSVAPALVKPNVNAWTRFPRTDPELTALLAANGIDPSKRIVYYSIWVAMPNSVSGPYDRNWLPTPLQQLEEPIPKDVRDKIIDRFIARHQMDGFFVQDMVVPANVTLPVPSWFDLLSRYYNFRVIAHSRNYRILRFTFRKEVSSTQAGHR